jgi:hypothetical protein
MNRLLRVSILAFLTFSPCYSFGAIVTYDFKGTVFGAGGSPYGTAIAGGAAVSGELKYDTSTVASSISGNVAIYPQTIPNGFMATFGSVPITASDYTVHIVNDQTQPNNSVQDIFTVEWASNDNPVPATPLSFNGTSQSAGIFSMSVFYPSSTFPDTSLPSSIPASGFNGFITSFLSHVPSGSVDVLYSVNTLTAVVPEPTNWAICLSGVPPLFLARYRFRRRQ